jgi:MerR family redox-sensitive transcriptional activator SoxR
MPKPNDLSVGEMAQRAGVPVSTLHFYEAEGLIQSWRTAANHRRYDRRELRRVAIARVAQSVGITLAEVRAVLDRVPRDRVVGKDDWATAASPWAAALDDRIALLLRLRDQIGYCIGCGCLSLDNCPLYNANDQLGQNGPGARRWTGDHDERAESPILPDAGQEVRGKADG